jgi:hypothetical protein
MPSTPVDKRNFYLALSVSDGQALANSVGFAIPSLEVQQNELIDTVQKWMTLAALGITDQVRECADWMTEVLLSFQDLDEDELKNTQTVLICFSIALLSYLIDSEYLELAVQDNGVLDPDRINRLLEFLTDEEIDLDISFDADFGEDEDDE